MIVLSRQVIISVSFLVVGCSTPGSVRDLAKTTAANTSLVNTTLQAFAENSRQTAERRGRYIADVNDAALDLKVSYEERLGAMRRVENKKKQKAGETKSATIGSTLTYLDELEANTDAAIAEQASLERAMAESQGKFDLPSDHLKTLAKKLGSLTEDRDNKNTLDFVKKVIADVVKQDKSAETAVKDANEAAETQAKTAADSAVKQAAKDTK